MSIHTNRNLIIRFFNENIYSHIIGDLKILDGIQPETHGNGCAIPTAMLILTSLDFIGYTLRTNGNSDDTAINITTALKHNNYFSEAYSDEVIKDLIVFYRHGLMHSFYPRQTSKKIYGIHKSTSLLLYENFNFEGYIVMSLNVNVLSSDFKVFIDKLYKEIIDTNDEIFLENMLRSFKLIYPETLANSSIIVAQTTMPYGVRACWGIIVGFLVQYVVT